MRDGVRPTEFGPISHLTWWQSILLLAAVAIEVPLIEEALFRGVVYAGLRHFFARDLPYSWAVGAAAGFSAVIFAAAHFEPHTAPVLFVLGLVLAYVYEYSGSIYVSAVTHGLQNSLALLAYVGIVHHG